MNKDLLKRIISDQQIETEAILEREKIIERERTSDALRFISHPNVLAVLGPRRCGKSVFSLLLSRQLEGPFAYINFDDERLIGTSTSDLDSILQAFYQIHGDMNVVVLDEVHNVKGWELFVNRLRRTKKVIITGSNSRMLSGELATHLTGRYIDVPLHTFSFREHIGLKTDVHSSRDIAMTRKCLSDYIEGSGFPEFRHFGAPIVRRIFDDIVQKDCIRRYSIRNTEAFRELSSYLITNFSNEFTYSALMRLCATRNVHTIKNHVRALREAFLIHVLERYSPRLRQRVKAPRKVYAIDQGLCNFVGFRRSSDLGRLYENVVCIDLLRRQAREPDLEVYYWKDHQQNEVDFVVKRGKVIEQLIQVCYSLDEEVTRHRETKGLLKASKELRCKDLLIITDDDESDQIVGSLRIRHIPLWRWLVYGA